MTNKNPSLLLRFLSPDPVLFWAYLLPVLYWSYLTLTTSFVLVFDSEGYFKLAHLFFDPGQWTQYFSTGPNREPLYPLLVAASMFTGKWLGISYAYPLRIVSFGLLLTTMVLIHMCLKLLNAKRWVRAGAVLYTGFSPILINSALCMFSEIVAFPWLVATVLTGFYYLRSLPEAGSKNYAPAAGLGLCLLGFTFVKGVGEILFPLFLSWLLWHAWQSSGLPPAGFFRRSRSKVLLVLMVFYIPLLGFKSLNYAFNGHFTSNDTRGIMALYGNSKIRADHPLTADNFMVHLWTTPVSYPLCARFFPQKECDQWNISVSDANFNSRMARLSAQNLSTDYKERLLRLEVLRAWTAHPFAQSVYFLQEGLKMFFWETSQGAFVAYPRWLEGLFNKNAVVLLMSLGIGGLCLAGFLAACTMLKNEFILTAVVTTGLLIFCFDFILIIHRYTIIAAPLMILLNASCLSVLTSKGSANK